MLLLDILVVLYFLIGWFIVGQSFERTKAAQDLNASLVEELTLVRRELATASKALNVVPKS